MENDFKGKKVVIMGLGGYKEGSGISAALFFARLEAYVIVTDLKREEELRLQIKKLDKFKNIEYVFGRHRDKDFKKADLIFQNPSVPDSSSYLKIARKNKIPIINDWSLFLEKHNNPLIGITGSRGKSTTTSLVYKIITMEKKAVLCGNIGVSPLKYLSKIKKSDIIVAEFSSWLLRGLLPVKKSPHIAVITNLKADHLDKYKNLEDYHNDKKIIFKFQKPDDYLILNKDDERSRAIAKEVVSKVFWFSKGYSKKDNGVFVKDNQIIFRRGGDEQKIANLSAVKMIGEHNLENALASICVAAIMSISKKNILSALRDFKGIPNRLELVSEIKGVKYYNDTTSTNPDGVIAALKAFDKKSGKIILIAGGVDKNLDYSEFVKLIDKSVKNLILFPGTATDKILRNIKVHYHTAHKMSEAVELAKSFAKKGDIVLLSPGAASFGLFKNEFDRGKQFVKEVNKL